MVLIRGGWVMDPADGTEGIRDLLLENGRIREIGTSLPEDGCEVIDAAGLVAAPGLVDTHVHFREPGQTEKEDILTGAAAAAKGGFTTVVCMANTVPPVDNPTLLRENLSRGRATGIHVLQASTVTAGMRGTQLVDMDAMSDAACFTDDGKPIADAALVEKAMRRARELGRVLSFHEEDASMLKGHGINEGKISRQLGIPGAAAAAEDMLVTRDCMLALKTGARIVIQHISSAASVMMVRRARAMGADVHAEATPHHFSLTEDAVPEHGTLAKMNPPLRTEADRAAIIEGLQDGTIDIIATDHAPHTAAEKAKAFPNAPSGIIGLETALSLGITNLVRPGHLTLMELLRKMTVGPASCYSMPNTGTLQVGMPADLVLFDPEARWTVERFASKSANSPFIGQRLYGVVIRTICGGRTVYMK